MLGVPATTPYDWNFSLFGFPIRVAPWFWLAALFFGQNAVKHPSVDGGPVGPKGLVAFALAMFLSIIIHELGHAFAHRFYGFGSSIVLYHFGGLAMRSGSRWDSARNRDNPWDQVAISAAGPALQVTVAVALAIVLRSFGIKATSEYLEMIGIRGGTILRNDLAFYFLYHFYWVSIVWAFFNLLPVYPLDGGQICRNLFLLFGGSNGINYSLMLSVATGGLLAVYGYQRGQIYLALMFASLAYSSYQALQAYGNGPRQW